MGGGAVMAVVHPVLGSQAGQHGTSQEEAGSQDDREDRVAETSHTKLSRESYRRRRLLSTGHKVSRPSGQTGT